MCTPEKWETAAEKCERQYRQLYFMQKITVGYLRKRYMQFGITEAKTGMCMKTQTMV